MGRTKSCGGEGEVVSVCELFVVTSFVFDWVSLFLSLLSMLVSLNLSSLTVVSMVLNFLWMSSKARFTQFMTSSTFSSLLPFLSIF